MRNKHTVQSYIHCFIGLLQQLSTHNIQTFTQTHAHLLNVFFIFLMTPDYKDEIAKTEY